MLIGIRLNSDIYAYNKGGPNRGAPKNPYMMYSIFAAADFRTSGRCPTPSSPCQASAYIYIYIYMYMFYVYMYVYMYTSMCIYK